MEARITWETRNKSSLQKLGRVPLSSQFWEMMLYRVSDDLMEVRMSFTSFTYDVGRLLPSLGDTHCRWLNAISQGHCCVPEFISYLIVLLVQVKNANSCTVESEASLVYLVSSRIARALWRPCPLSSPKNANSFVST